MCGGDKAQKARVIPSLTQGNSDSVKIVSCIGVYTDMHIFGMELMYTELVPCLSG